MALLCGPCRQDRLCVMLPGAWAGIAVVHARSVGRMGTSACRTLCGVAATRRRPVSGGSAGYASGRTRGARGLATRPFTWTKTRARQFAFALLAESYTSMCPSVSGTRSKLSMIASRAAAAAHDLRDLGDGLRLCAHRPCPPVAAPATRVRWKRVS